MTVIRISENRSTVHDYILIVPPQGGESFSYNRPTSPPVPQAGHGRAENFYFLIHKFLALFDAQDHRVSTNAPYDVYRLIQNHTSTHLCITPNTVKRHPYCGNEFTTKVEHRVDFVSESPLLSVRNSFVLNVFLKNKPLKIDNVFSVFHLKIVLKIWI